MTNLTQLIAAVRIAAAQRLSPMRGVLEPMLPAPQFLGQHYATPEKKARRALVKEVGRRQARKIQRARRAVAAAV